jgi:NAD(P)-dependent dehydrogenase (short-subunit alcohol dehydrogenase family)
MSLDGKTALVTGSSRGIGKGIALAFAERGADVAIHYYENESAASDTLEEVRALGSDSFMVQADVREVDDIRAMYGKVKDEFGTLDIVVNNARPELPVFFYPPMEITVEQYDSAVDSQAKAFLVSTQEAAALMPDGGRILAVTYTPGSVTGGFQSWVAMGAGKSAMVTLAQYFAVALAERGITVNVISPGWTEPSVVNSLPESAQDLIRNWHKSGWTPMRRMGSPEDIGKAAALLCSDDAAWITGQVIAADGGASLMLSQVPPEFQLG